MQQALLVPQDYCEAPFRTFVVTWQKQLASQQVPPLVHQEQQPAPLKKYTNYINMNITQFTVLSISIGMSQVYKMIMYMNT